MTKNTENYIPIECGLHSEYELAIMHKRKVNLIWLNANNEEQSEIVEPVDIFSKNKQEFLKIRTAENNTHKIRLDKIKTFITI